MKYQLDVSLYHEQLKNKTGYGNNYLGWHDWPVNFSYSELKDIQDTAEYIRNNCDVFIVCGIGGSYLGAKAAIEMINGLYNYNGPEIIFIGNTFSSNYIHQVLQYIKDKDIICNVISKSGTTTETALAFRIIRQFIEEKYKEKSKDRIFVTTDIEKGTLKQMSNIKGYKTFVIPDDIGGRFSVNTPVGLLPIAVAGIDIKSLMYGCKQAYKDFDNDNLEENQAYQYAVCRHIMDRKGKTAEMLISYEPQMAMFAEWWKQLFGESEGKSELGILPCSAIFSTDLHSMGQFIQDGKKCLFETLIKIENPTFDITFPEDKEDLDKMNYLSGKSINWINQMACEGTTKAHVETGKVPNLEITIPNMDAFSFGYLIYFFFKAIAISTYLNKENPFDQPGVEIYKKNMFKLLGK